MQNNDIRYMRLALKLAKKAASKDEVPVGAVLVGPEGVVAYGYNLRETIQSPLAHAEMLALHTASRKMKSWRMPGLTLYVTLEPCVMCAGALVQSRISRVVYGASDPKGGGAQSLYQILNDTRLNHQIEVISGVLESDCSQILKDFFKKKRLQKKGVQKNKI